MIGILGVKPLLDLQYQHQASRQDEGPIDEKQHDIKRYAEAFVSGLVLFIIQELAVGVFHFEVLGDE